ncbi:sigma-70 family RNA polymerase sigma factor [Singulisphaera acidiphila]|uniref:sigma-70 family RNA polymerase sigma factor n=1 Tax=Singulisphaera acidiphila TaxID=466153 RepID=UPI00024724F3|nr:sigma-70 family RNA polymerase sigma factor [Singulisphaera acidiphila]
MKPRETIRVQFPILYAYDGKQEFLSNEATQLATREERLRSVWPFLTRRALEFSKTLKERERVNFDLEDVAAELWVALATRDHKWSPERGRYLTFAGTIIDNELCSIRDRARTVQSPRNSFCRIKEYQAEAENGEISARRLKTLADIRRTGFGLSPIDGSGRDFDRAIHDDPAASILTQEEADEKLNALRSAISILTPTEAEVLRRTAGIFGTPRQTSKAVAKSLELTEWEVAEIKARALQKVRSHLTAPKQSAA